MTDGEPVRGGDLLHLRESLDAEAPGDRHVANRAPLHRRTEHHQLPVICAIEPDGVPTRGDERAGRLRLLARGAMLERLLEEAIPPALPSPLVALLVDPVDELDLPLPVLPCRV